MKKRPCYQCSDRKVRCHAQCDKPEYLEWREEQERVKAVRQQMRDEENIHQHYARSFRERYKRRYGIK